jgi:hypothetical protein
MCVAQRRREVCRGELRELVVAGEASGAHFCPWHVSEFVRSFAPLDEFYEDVPSTGQRRYIIETRAASGAAECP